MIDTIVSVTLVTTVIYILVAMPRDARRLQPVPFILATRKRTRRLWLLHEGRRVAENNYRQVKKDIDILGDALSDVDKRLVSSRISSTITRWGFRNFLERRAWNWFALLAVSLTAMFMAEPPNTDISSGLWDTARWTYACIGVCVLLGAIALRMTRMRVGLYGDFWVPTGPPVQMIYLGMIAALVRVMYGLVQIREKGSYETQKSLYALAIFQVLALTAFAFIASSAVAVSKYRGAMEPLDIMVMRLFGIAHRLQRIERQRSWAHSGNTSNVVSELERTARTAERAMLRRAVRWDPSFQRDVRSFGAKLGAVIRVHKAPLATATGPRDIVRVRQSLMVGLVAWANRDGKALIALAPDITFQGRVIGFVRRMMPAVTLAAAAMLLPLLPALQNQASELRIVLGAMSAVSVLSGGVSPAATVSNILDRVMQGGK